MLRVLGRQKCVALKVMKIQFGIGPILDLLDDMKNTDYEHFEL
jgi:hypothetical protein